MRGHLPVADRRARSWICPAAAEFTLPLNTLEKLMKFYDCQPAPSPRRARIFIAEKGLDIETVQVDLGAREQLGPEF